MRLFVFGVGYSSRQCVAKLRDKCKWLGGTTRSLNNFPILEEMGISPYLFDRSIPNSCIQEALRRSTHVLVSIPPVSNADSVLNAFEESLLDSEIEWIGYLSTVGVYGNHNGAWVNEDTVCTPTSSRSRNRLKVESEWMNFSCNSNAKLCIFRLSGIYGRGRNAIVNLENGKAKRIIKSGQVFNRIHVEDIAGAVEASIERSISGTFNVTDNEPCPPQDVVKFAADLLGMEPPREQLFEDADLSKMARSFYSENKRVSNRKLREVIGYQLRFPNYKIALKHMHETGWR